MLSKDIKLMLCQPSVVSAVSRWEKSYDVAWCIRNVTIKDVSALYLTNSHGIFFMVQIVLKKVIKSQKVRLKLVLTLNLCVLQSSTSFIFLVSVRTLSSYNNPNRQKDQKWPPVYRTPSTILSISKPYSRTVLCAKINDFVPNYRYSIWLGFLFSTSLKSPHLMVVLTSFHINIMIILKLKTVSKKTTSYF